MWCWLQLLSEIVNSKKVVSSESWKTDSHFCKPTQAPWVSNISFHSFTCKQNNGQVSGPIRPWSPRFLCDASTGDLHLSWRILLGKVDAGNLSCSSSEATGDCCGAQPN